MPKEEEPKPLFNARTATHEEYAAQKRQAISQIQQDGYAIAHRREMERLGVKEEK